MATATSEALELDQYLTFLLASEEYAIEILKVREIIEYDTVTIVPKTPQWIRGVINLRGSVVPVVDLGLKFSIGARPVTRTTCIVIVEGTWDGELIAMGVMADSVNQVMDIAGREILEVPAFGTRVKVDYLKGMAQSGKKFALLLDIDKILSADEMLELNDAVTTLKEIQSTVSLPDLPELMLSAESSGAAEENSRVQKE
jgi:purine-binding chemotaxis protein CheW